MPNARHGDAASIAYDTANRRMAALDVPPSEPLVAAVDELYQLAREATSARTAPRPPAAPLTPAITTPQESTPPY